MNSIASRVTTLLGSSLLATSAAWGFPLIVVSPLTPQPVPTPPLFEASGKAVGVLAVDARADKSFIADALIGPGADAGSGVFMGYGTPRGEDLAAFVETSAADALPVLGFRPGKGSASDWNLTLTIVEFRVDMYRVSGFAPMNCMGYGVVQAVLKDAGGNDVRSRTLHLAYYENTVPKMSMKEVTTGALSRIYAQAAWEAVASVLLEAAAPMPDAAAIEALARSIPDTKDDIAARRGIFWLGIVHQPLGAVTEALMASFRAPGEQKAFQAAAEALGKLGVAEAKPPIEAILSGAEEIGDWDNADDEHVWYLLRALADLGETDLASKVPKTKLTMPSKLKDLIAFEASGTIPKISPAGAAKLDEAKKKLDKKRK